VEEALRPGEIGLNLGSGNVYWDGWLNVDLYSRRADIKCDLRKLDFSDSYADRIVAIHVFEHFYLWEAEDMLGEWKRVLRPGGTLSLELPCMDKVFGHIAARIGKGQPPARFMSWLPIWGDPRHREPAMCHKWGYFRGDMDAVLTRAGFVDVTHEEPRYHFPIRDMRVTARKPKEMK
jgi:SAM-dependent methyltransferase